MNAPEILNEFEERELPVSVADLSQIERSKQKALAIEWTREGKSKVKALNRVGTVVLKDRRFIIRPKIHKVNFLHMLKDSYDLIEFDLHNFSLEKEQEIDDIIVEIFLKRVSELVRRGLSKDYFTDEENLPFLRGRWLPLEDKRKNPPPRTRVFCRYPEFSQDTPENRILGLAINELRGGYVDSRALRRMAVSLAHYFDPCSIITRFQLPSVKYTRLNEHYRPLVNSALFVIRNATINAEKAGEQPFYSFLVDLEVLFERFLRSQLRRAALPLRLQVFGGTDRHEPWYLVESEKFRLKPDIVIGKDGKPLIVVDAKYKEMTGPQDIKSEDLYEVVSYCVSLGAKLAILVYPQQKGFVLDGVPERVRGTDMKLALRTIPLYQKDQSQFNENVNNFTQQVFQLTQQVGS